MSAQILSGTALAARVRDELSLRATQFRAQGFVPCLAVVLIGDDPASAVYVRNKERAAAAVGVETRDHRWPADTSQARFMELIDQLNADPAVDGILVQLPLPKHLDTRAVLMRVAPHKDVDGFHPNNLGSLAGGMPCFVACTPRGCMALLNEARAPISGANALVVGRSNIVGKPMALLLLNANATVTIAHSKTRNLPELVGTADILIAAIGRPEFIRGEWIKPGAYVIDVGMNRTDDGKLVGDVEFATAQTRAAVITPVPGGVGPMTIAMLLANTLDATERRTQAG